MRVLVDLLVPPHCDGCGVPSPPPWCEDCEARAQARRPARPCPVCADADVTGHPCWRGAPPVDRLVTWAPWTGGVARAVARAKLAGRREVLAAAGARIGEAFLASACACDVVVPVPTDARRARRRGHDHTAAMARALGRSLGVPVVAALRPAGRLVDAARAGGRHDGRDAVPPRAQPFVASSQAGRVAGASVVVVDDVVTTGATLAAAAATLRRAGALRVVGAVVGRAGGHVLGG